MEMEINAQLEKNVLDVQRLSEREHRLHRLMAASAFVFALCLLPVAQYFLVTGNMSEQDRIALEKKMQADENSRVGGGEVREFANQGEETGQVAGASTEEQNTSGSELNGINGAKSSSGPIVYKNRDECLTATQKDMEDLERFANGKKTAMLAEHYKRIEPYKQALEVTTGETTEQIAQGKAALQSEIDRDYYQVYIPELNQVEAAVTESRNEILNRCD